MRIPPTPYTPPSLRGTGPDAVTFLYRIAAEEQAEFDAFYDARGEKERRAHVRKQLVEAVENARASKQALEVLDETLTAVQRMQRDRHNATIETVEQNLEEYADVADWSPADLEDVAQMSVRFIVGYMDADNRTTGHAWPRTTGDALSLLRKMPLGAVRELITAMRFGEVDEDTIPKS